MALLCGLVSSLTSRKLLRRRVHQRSNSFSRYLHLLFYKYRGFVEENCVLAYS